MNGWWYVLSYRKIIRQNLYYTTTLPPTRVFCIYVLNRIIPIGRTQVQTFGLMMSSAHRLPELPINKWRNVPLCSLRTTVLWGLDEKARWENTFKDVGVIRVIQAFYNELVRSVSDMFFCSVPRIQVWFEVWDTFMWPFYIAEMCDSQNSWYFVIT